MAALVAPLVSTSLEVALTTHTAQQSRELYNQLLDDGDQPAVDDAHIQRLAAMFVSHNAHHVLGIHLIHRHFKLPEKSVLLGKSFEHPQGRWAQVTDVGGMDLSTVHGHIFVYQNGGLQPYEYQEGPLPSFSEVKPGFLQAFVDYISQNNLTNLIGLQVLGDCNKCAMSELILDNGTVMIRTDALKNCTPYRITGWRFEEGPNGPRCCQSNETHAGMTSGNHKVFNAGKPLPKLESVDDLKIALADVGIL
ncbi:hypothetical protein NHJ13051_009915 [Beauveria bassiana]